MNGRERILTLLRGETPDHAPVFPKISFAAAALTGVCSVGEYMRNPDAMAEAVLCAQERFGWDGIGLTTDISVNGMALGSVYEWHEDRPYSLRKPLLNNIGDADRVPLPDPWEAPGEMTVLRATQAVKKAAGEWVLVQAWTNGPLNIASQLVEYDELLVGMITEPSAVHALLEKCLIASQIYAKELVRAGADAVAFGHAVASCSVISREMYAEFALPYEKRLTAAIHEAGGIAITHICGRIEPCIDLISQNGSDIVDFDHENSYGALIEAAKRNVVLRGNIDPALLCNGMPVQTERAAEALLESAKGTNRLILGTGCEVQTNTKTENLEALVRAGRSFTR